MAVAEPGPVPHGVVAEAPSAGPPPTSGDRRREGGRKGGDGGGREQRMVPDATPRSYYGEPVLKAPTWTWEIPAYLFTGGLAAGSTLVGAAARLRGDTAAARWASGVSLGAVGVSSVLLIDDLGRPARFHHMLRVFKPTSPMSVGTWIFSAFSALVGASAAADVAVARRWLPASLAGVARPGVTVTQVAAAVVAPALATYTAVLVADTAVPAWHEARRELPWVFAGSAASTGAGAALVTSALRGAPLPAGPRSLALVGAVVEVVADEAMHRRLRGIATGDPVTPDLSEALARGGAGRLATGARVALVGGGAAVAAAGGRRRGLAAVGGAALMVGSALERFAVFQAGKASAADPVYTVGPQRARLVRNGTRL